MVAMKLRPLPARWQAAFWMIISLWLLGSLLTLVLYSETNSAPTLLQPGQTAPSFHLSDQYGHPHRLDNYTKGGVALVFFPGTDPDSLAQLRSLNASIAQLDAIGAKVFAITPLKPDITRPLHDKEKLAFPILTDTEGRVGQQYRITFGADGSGRVSYVVGPNGKVLMPVREVQPRQHGAQMVSMVECCLEAEPAAPSRNIGTHIANFTLPRVRDGKPESLLGDGKQQATVLLFLSAHCPCSQRYDERNRELARRYSERGVRFVAVNSAFDETIAEVAEHAQKQSFPFPVLKDRDNIVADKLEAHVTPEAFVLDKNGVLRYHGRVDDNRDPEQVTANDLQNALDALLAGKLPAQSDRTAFGCAIYRKPAG